LKAVLGRRVQDLSEVGVRIPQEYADAGVVRAEGGHAGCELPVEIEDLILLDGLDIRGLVEELNQPNEKESYAIVRRLPAACARSEAR
jgi:hypothetical protein